MPERIECGPCPSLVFFVAVTAAFLRGAVEKPRNALLLQSRDSQQYDPRNAIHSVCRACRGT